MGNNIPLEATTVSPVSLPALPPKVNQPFEPVPYPSLVNSDDLGEWYEDHPENGVHFRERGKIIGSLDFAHMVLDIDLVDVAITMNKVCDQTDKAYAKSKADKTSYFRDTLETCKERCDLAKEELMDQERIWFGAKLDEVIRTHQGTDTDTLKRERKDNYLWLLWRVC